MKSHSEKVIAYSWKLFIKQIIGKALHATDELCKIKVNDLCHEMFRKAYQHDIGVNVYGCRSGVFRSQ